MDLKEIAAISGKGGLFKVLKPTRSGVILESLDEQKSRSAASAQSRVSLLKEISIYTTGTEGSVPLEEVFQKVYEKYGNNPLPVDGKSDAESLADFMAEVLPEYDRERVYSSDMKKLVTWYAILIKYAPELFETKTDEMKSEEERPVAEEIKAEEKPQLGEKQ